MTRPYSKDLRERAVARYELGETTRSVAAALKISPSCVSKWVKLQRETGSLAPGQIGGHKKPKLRGQPAEWLRERCRSGPFTTRGLVAELAERGIKSDRRAVWVFVHAEGLSFKKTVLAAEQTRPDIARKRERWKAHQGRIDPRRLVFLDETWVKTNMAPLRGWGPRGQRLPARVPHGHWKTLTFIAALRADRVDAPWVIDGPINGELFTLYVEKVLVPTLTPGDVVIRRTHARPPRQKEAVLGDDLLAMLATLPTDLRGIRDRAILLLGFAGALRRSEIVGLDCGPGETQDGGGWIEVLPAGPSSSGGLLLTVRGKTGWRTVEVGRGSSDRSCPVAALETWLRLGRVAHGPVFRPIAKANAGVSAARLSDKHVVRLVQKSALAAGIRGDLNEGARRLAFGCHSLRAGLATAADVEEALVQKQLGHASAEMTRGYKRRRDRFAVNLTKATGL